MFTKDKFLHILGGKETSQNLADLEEFINSMQQAEAAWIEAKKVHDASREPGSIWESAPPEKPHTDSEACFGSSIASGSSMNLAGAALLVGKPKFFKKIVELMPKLLFAHSYSDHTGGTRKWKTPLEIAIDTGNIEIINWILTFDNKDQLMLDADKKLPDAPRHDMLYYQDYARQKAKDCKKIPKAIKAAAEKAAELPNNAKDYQWHTDNAEQKISDFKVGWSDEKQLELCVEILKSIQTELKQGEEGSEVTLGEVDLLRQYDKYKMKLLEPLLDAVVEKAIYLGDIKKSCTTLKKAINNRNLAGITSLFTDGGISYNIPLIERNLRALGEAENIQWEDSKNRSFAIYIAEAEEMVRKADEIEEALNHPIIPNLRPQTFPLKEDAPPEPEYKKPAKKPYNRSLVVTKQVYIEALRETFNEVGFDIGAEDIVAEVQRLTKDSNPTTFLQNLNERLMDKLEPQGVVKAEVVEIKRIDKTQEEPEPEPEVLPEPLVEVQSFKHVVKVLGHDVDWFMEHLDEELAKADDTLSCLDTIRQNLQDTSFQERVYKGAAEETISEIDSSLDWNTKDLAETVSQAINEDNREQIKSLFMDNLVKHLKSELGIEPQDLTIPEENQATELHTEEKADSGALLRIVTGMALGLIAGVGVLYLLRAKTAFPKEIAPSSGLIVAFSLTGGFLAYLTNTATSPKMER